MQHSQKSGTLTVLRDVRDRPATKVHQRIKPGIFETTSYPRGMTWFQTAESSPLASIHDFWDWFEIIELERTTFCVRGRITELANRNRTRRMHISRHGRPATLEDVSRHLHCIDIDTLPLPQNMSVLTTPDEAIEHARTEIAQKPPSPATEAMSISMTSLIGLTIKRQ